MLRLPLLTMFCALLACDHDAPTSAAPTRDATTPRAPIRMTYLGVAGWQIDSGATTVLLDPYFSRPDLDAEIVSDAAAVQRRSPARAALVLVGHSHVDHLLDVPAVAERTGADVLGSPSTAIVARASGLPASRIITVEGGEDLAFDDFSVRVLPSLHSALDDKHTFGADVAPDFHVPARFDDYAEGGTLAYLLRIGGHTIFLQSTANFIERELEGLDPDIAVVATGLRQEVHDYTCRLMRVLDHPPLVYVNHFDDWRAPPKDEPTSEDLQAFVAEVAACSPGTKVVIPRHFEPMTTP